ncbi:MAG: energy transducer TonB, partial [Pseudanabaena sp.]
QLRQQRLRVNVDSKEFEGLTKEISDTEKNIKELENKQILVDFDKNSLQGLQVRLSELQTKQTKVAVDVDSNGNVINVRLLNSSGHAELDEVVKQAAWNWKFDPSQNGKQAIPASINFQIENSDYAKRRQEQRKLEPRREENIAPIAAPIQPN